MTFMASSGLRQIVYYASVHLAKIRSSYVVLLPIHDVSSNTRMNMLLEGPLIDHVHVTIEDVIHSVYAYMFGLHL